MDSAYDADRIFGILMRLRACLGIVAGLAVLAMCGLVGGAAASAPNVPRTRILDAKGRPVSAEEESAIRASIRAQAGRGSAVPELSPETSSEPRGRSSPAPLVFGAVALLIFAITAFEFAIGSWIGNGERHGFQWGAGIEGLACLLGLFNLGASPLAIVGFLLSLATFVYCLARLTGMGPKPI